MLLIVFARLFDIIFIVNVTIWVLNSQRIRIEAFDLQAGFLVVSSSLVVAWRSKLLLLLLPIFVDSVPFMANGELERLDAA